MEAVSDSVGDRVVGYCGFDRSGVDRNQPSVGHGFGLDSVVHRYLLARLRWIELDCRHGDQLLQDRTGRGRATHGDGDIGRNQRRSE